MSYISTLVGRLEFQSDEDYQDARRYLYRGDWAEKLQFYNVNQAPSDNAVIEIPFDSYRNLGRSLDTLLELASSGFVVGTSNDVYWHGFCERADGESVEHDLHDWAAENLTDLPEPAKADFETGDEWFDEYIEWQATCETSYRTAMKPEPL